MTDIILKKYQENFVNDILTDNLHGKIMYWNMGTGKTIGALSIVLNYPDKDIILIIPEEIEVVWKNEINLIGVKNQFEIIYYNQIKKLENISTKNKLIILDEAHNLKESFKGSIELEENIINKFNESFKIILLSGTPVYNNFEELNYLVNIAAGKEIIPYNYYKFNNEYNNIKINKSIIQGYIIEYSNILDISNKFFVFIFIIIISIYVFYSFYYGPNPFLYKFLTFLPINFQKIINIPMKIFYYSLLKILFNGSTKKYIIEFINLYSTASLQNLNLKYSKIVHCFTEFVINYRYINSSLSYEEIVKQLKNNKEFIDSLNTFITYKELKDIGINKNEIKDKFNEVIKYIENNGEDSIIFLKNLIHLENTKIENVDFENVYTLFNIIVYKTQFYINAMIFFVGILNVIKFISYLISKGKQIEDFKYFNTKKYYNKIENYINFYENTQDSTNLIYYPKTISISKSVKYTNYQLDTFYELTQNVFKDETISILSDLKNNKYNIENVSTLENYIKYGLQIGNIIKNNTCSKFENIYKLAKGKRAVFYSSYIKGINNFKEFLTSKKENYLFLDKNITINEKNNILESFKNETIFLILHPVYTEGITIKGAEQMHILEPIENVSKKNQLCARVSRYMSHSHLPENKRIVYIYQWYCILPNKVISKFGKLKNWFKYNKEVLFTFGYNKYQQNITPDQIVMNKFLADNKKLIGVLELLRNKKTKEPNCCIKFPSKIQEEKCLENKKSCFIGKNTEVFSPKKRSFGKNKKNRKNKSVFSKNKLVFSKSRKKIYNY